MSAAHRGGPPPKRQRPSSAGTQTALKEVDYERQDFNTTGASHQLERRISRALRRYVGRFLAGDREAARAAFQRARKLIGRRSAAQVQQLEVELGLRRA